MATFVLANFVAHAATVKSQPGESAISVFVALVLALCFPGFGTSRGLDAIFGHAITGSSALQKAKKAGALCQVARTPDWKPQSGDIVRDVRVIKNTSLQEWRDDGAGIFNSRGLHNDLKLDEDLELDDVSDARNQVSNRTESKLNDTTDGVSDTVEKDNSIMLEQFLPSPRTLCPAHSSPLPSQILQIQGLFNGPMFEPSTHTFALEGRKVHGICRLPHGFALAPVGINATVVELDDVRNHKESPTKSQPKTTIEISSLYSLTQGLVAVCQTLYASATLYKARGDQIKMYGYAAFGLTVAPYLVMSILNLLGTILTPNYPTTFMVDSEIMREAARRDGAQFNGVVGMLEIDQSLTKGPDMAFQIDEQGQCSVRQHHSTSSSTAHGNSATRVEEAVEVSRQPGLIEIDPKDDDRVVKRIVLVPAIYPYFSPYYMTHRIRIFPLRILVGLTSLAINGVLTRFQAGNSTRAQRVWTMAWLAFGIWIGSSSSNVIDDVKEIQHFVAALLGLDVRKGKRLGDLVFIAWVLIYAVYSAVAIGGFVVVCQMLLQYGNCTEMY